MVDFQQRDTSRGLDNDAEDESDDEQEADEHVPDDGGTQHDDEGHSHKHDDDSHDHEHTDEGHDHHHHDVDSLGAAIVTVSTSRTLDDDPAGDAIAAAFEGEGHEVVARELVGDAHGAVRDTVDALAEADVDVVVTTGGTGVTPDDVTIEAVSALFEKELPGFGELFRMLSYDEIGTRIVGTRATAGIVGETPVFCLPGSENAARLGAEAIIVEEAGHLAGLAGR